LNLVIINEHEHALDVAALDFFERTEVGVPITHAGVPVPHCVRKVCNIDRFPPRHHASMGEDVFELTDISWPGMPS
jgi:hypothetical protein